MPVAKGAIPHYRTQQERQNICRRHGRWPEVRVVDVNRQCDMLQLTLSCGHITRRLMWRGDRATSVFVCEQCAAGDPLP